MKADIVAAIQEAASELGFLAVDFVVEHPGDIEHGDYASNVALVAAGELKKRAVAGEVVKVKAPREIAEQFLAALSSRIPHVDRIEIAGPGFLNFHLSRDFFRDKIATINQAADTWGSNDTQKEEYVVIEYTSPNLFKPLHIGNLVGNIVGESISRLFIFSGATVRRFNYPSDIGLTVAKGVWGLQHLKADPSDIEALGAAYREGNEAYEAGGVAAEEIIAINQALYAGSDAVLNELREQGIETSKKHLTQLLNKLGTQFDYEITESKASAPGMDFVTQHIGDVFEKSDGAVVFKGESVGLHTRVFLNSKGLPTYEAKDIGHFSLKQQAAPEWTRSIIVTGNEQREYFKVVFAVLKKLFPEIVDKKLEHIPTGFLTLTTGKMSSRKGNVLTGESLIEEMEAAAHKRATTTRTNDVAELTTQVAVAALKYQILRNGIGSDIVFDKEKSLSFEGDSGPYLQYTYARAGSVLEKAAAAGVSPSTKTPPTAAYPLERLIYQFPEVIETALEERAPHKVATFLTELASSFNSFYAEEQIANPEDLFASYKAALTEATRITLKNGLFTLGIEAPERM